MFSRRLLIASLLVGCTGEDMAYRGLPREVSWTRSDRDWEDPGYDSLVPSDAINIVAFGDSGTQGFGDDVAQGGWVSRVIDQIVATYGAGHRFRWRGTNAVRGYIGTHYTEGHGGLEFKPESEWGSMAEGASVDNVDQALLNKPIDGDGTGRPMFGLSGYHQQNLHLLLWGVGAGNVNNYEQTAEEVMTMTLASLRRGRDEVNELSQNCLIYFSPSLLDWSGATPEAAELNHQRVLEQIALLPDLVSDFNALYPSQPLIVGASWYDAIGPYNAINYFDTVHPNEAGYDLLGAAQWAALAPVLAGLV